LEFQENIIFDGKIHLIIRLILSVMKIISCD